MSVITNIGTWLLTGASIIKHFADQIRIRLKEKEKNLLNNDYLLRLGPEN